MVELGLILILILVLLLPFLSHKVEENLEIFLFIMGILSCLITGVMDYHIIREAIIEPWKITAAVFLSGLLFKFTRHYLRQSIEKILEVIPEPLFISLVVVILGLSSSIITAIIASLFLVEIISAMRYEKSYETKIIVISCFSIGLGAALTPIGEPLSAIAIAKLKHLPHVDFFYLLRLLGVLILSAILILGLIAYFIKGRETKGTLGIPEEEETYLGVALRAAKVYLFVMALIFLGKGFTLIIDRYIIFLDPGILYWINMVSAILDNATLTAAEISDKMTDIQVKSILMGLLISGGMLIPGNIPNIICANKLKIKSRDWARTGVPLGLIMMVIYFLILFYLL